MSTAKEFLIKQRVAENSPSSLECVLVEYWMVEFAKLHVTEALKRACGNVEAELEPLGWLAEQHLTLPFIAGEDYEIGISSSSILNAYSLDNIK